MKWSTIFCAVLAVTPVLAHEGVKNHAVMVRMDAMADISLALKAMDKMVQGETTFDAARARTLAATLASHAAQTVDLFEDAETDPKSEARPAIWTSFADFAAKADAMEQAANRAATEVDGVDTLRHAVRELNGTCRACHTLYRETR